MTTEAPRRRAEAYEIAIVCLARSALVGATLVAGFRAISDDDYARTVIAERLVAEPRLDPSGTSWLPAPFHLLGAAMAIFGRTLLVARVASVALAIGAGALVHLALVRHGVPRRARLVAMGALSLLPWTLYTTAATVPEALTASAVAAAALFATLERARATAATRIAAGALVALATLSRYEAWPAAVVVAVLLVVSVQGEKPRAIAGAIAGALLAVAGVAAWMAWNRATHGSATHFLFRVARFKRALGGPEASLAERLGAYPRLLVVHFPEAIAALAVIVASVRRRDGLRRARVGALAVSSAVLAFLVYGTLADGVPTHHAERALLGIATLVVPVAIATLAERGTTRGWVAFGAVVGALELFHVGATEMPGRGGADRSEQVARGHALRGEPTLTVVPCAYEHFALVAAYGRPEAVTIGPPAPATANERCPRVIAPSE